MMYVAPAGTRISLIHFIKWFAILFKGNIYAKFSGSIYRRFGIKHSIFVSSGRAALFIIVESLKEACPKKNRNIIIIPSYTCYSVPAAIIRAGLKPYICDIDPKSLSYNYEALNKIDYSNVLAITSSNLYGNPNNLYELEQFAQSKDIYLIDDAAQAMGSKINDRYVGSFGDVGLYSFDKGKNITSIQGGVIVTQKDKLAEIINNKIETLQNMPLHSLISYVLKAFLYALLLHPYLYWIPNKLPFLELGQTRYEIDYPITRYSPILAGLAYTLFNDIDSLNTQRISNAQYLLTRLSNQSIIAPISSPADSISVFPRIAFLAINQSVRNRLIELMNIAGIGATASYPKSISEIDQINDKVLKEKSCSGGLLVSKTIITLPTHGYVCHRHLQKMLNIIAFQNSQEYDKKKSLNELNKN